MKVVHSFRNTVGGGVIEWICFYLTFIIILSVFLLHCVTALLWWSVKAVVSWWCVHSMHCCKNTLWFGELCSTWNVASVFRFHFFVQRFLSFLCLSPSWCNSHVDWVLATCYLCFSVCLCLSPSWCNSHVDWVLATCYLFLCMCVSLLPDATAMLIGC